MRIQKILQTQTRLSLTREFASLTTAPTEWTTKKTDEPIGQGKDGADAIEVARRDSLLADPSRSIGPREEQTLRSRPSVSKSQGGTGQTGKSVHSAQVEPSASTCISGQDQGRPPNADTESRLTNSLGYRGAEEDRKEAASAQAVERGHQVAMIKVPDKEDDTAYQQWLAKGSPIVTLTRPVVTLQMPPNSPIQIGRMYTDGQTYQDRQTQSKVTSPTVVAPITANAKVWEVPRQGWMKPLSVEWTLQNIQEARSDNAARAQLVLWMHKDRLRELTDKLLEELRMGGETALERLYELREPIRYIHGASGDFSIPMTIEPCTGRQTLTTKALIDSSCTGSAINQAYVEKHQLDMRKASVSIPVYNADRTRNQGRDITKFVELSLTIGEHHEWIDLAVTNLGKKDIYLGHDWLKCHNLSINWEHGTIIFGRCDCMGERLVLPDADPDNHWDEELEEGDTILVVQMEEELVIRAMHHANDLAAATHTEKPKKTFEEMVPEHYHSFWDLFAKENFNELPKRKPWDHAIELVPNVKSTLDCKVYLLNWNELEQLDKFLNENLESGRIRPSKSPFASPFFFVKKKDGTLRPVQDYRKLNEMTIKNCYPLLLISELTDKLRGAKYFTKLDVRWGYNNVQIQEGDEEKAAFQTNQGLFEPTVMFFGLTNSPATFQWMMNNIFCDLIGEGKVTIYLDNILIFSKNLNKHRQIVKCVLQRLRENKLFLKVEKCKFEVLETEYLGVIISEDSVRMDPVKITGIAEWPMPAKKKELQPFLGFTNFYQKFIKNYSKVVKVLTQLTGNTAWTWGKPQEDTFKELKRRMAEDVILAIPNDDDPFRVEADAGEGTVGAVLSQQQNGVWCPVAFMSKSLSATEWNYEIYNKKLLAIMLALSEWRHYLMGAAKDVEI